MPVIDRLEAVQVQQHHAVQAGFGKHLGRTRLQPGPVGQAGHGIGLSGLGQPAGFLLQCQLLRLDQPNTAAECQGKHQHFHDDAQLQPVRDHER